MPLSFSNVLPKVKNLATSTIGNFLLPGLGGSLASAALQKKITPPPLPVISSPAAAQTNVAAKPKTTPAATPRTAVAAPKPTTYQAPPASQAVYTPPSQPQTPPKAAEPQQPTFGGILFDLLKKATEGNQNVQSAREDLSKFQQAQAQKIADIRSEPIPLEFQQGRAQVVQQAAAEKEKALETGVQNALTSQQQELGALGTAAGLAQPAQVPYSNQFLSPLNGQPINNGQSGGSLNEQVGLIAEKVKNGSMSYDQGVSALSGYGQGGLNALQQALGPNFDIVSSNAKAAANAASTLQTGTTGGQLSKAADSALAALDKLEKDFGNLGALQTQGLPGTNSIANFIAGSLGQGALSQYQTTLADARAQLEGVLTATGATTPTGAEEMAKTYLPDNMTPTQLKEKLAAARALIQQKVGAFTTPPQTGASGEQTSAGGYNFKLVNGKWVPA